MKNQLLSIGRFAAMTGVSERSLRYYKRIDILHPEKIDPRTGYRYYNYEQIRVVDGIRFCLDAGLSLKEVRDILSSETVDESTLFARARASLETKIDRLQYHLEHIRMLQENNRRGAVLLQADGSVCFDFPQKNYLIVPLSPDSAKDGEAAAELSLLYQAAKLNDSHFFNYGRMNHYHNGRLLDEWVFSEEENPSEKEIPGIRKLGIPESVRCILSVPARALNAAEHLFPDQFARPGHLLIFESRSIAGSYNVHAPRFELNCCRTEDF